MASLVLGVTVLLVACSGSESAVPSTKQDDAKLSLPASVEAPGFTTMSSSTTTLITTTNPPAVGNTVSTGSSEPAPEASAPDSLPAPTDTMFDPATPEGEVEQAVLANFDAFSVCLSQLPNCDPLAATRVAALDYAIDNVKLIETWNVDGLEIRQLDDLELSVERVELNEDATEAIAYTCSFDGSQLVIPSTQEIVDAGNLSSKSKYLVIRIDDSWLVTAKENVETVPGRVEGFCF